VSDEGSYTCSGNTATFIGSNTDYYTTVTVSWNTLTFERNIYTKQQ